MGNKGVKALICDSTRALTLGKTPSEQVAKEMLKDVMLGTDSSGKAIVFTTFSSHIARLKSAVEFAQQIGRKVVILGRSLGKYIEAAENVHLVDFSKTCEIVRYGKHIRRKLQEIQRSPEKYVMIVTGHQAFFTRDAMARIAHTTLSNISDVEAGRPWTNEPWENPRHAHQALTGPGSRPVIAWDESPIRGGSRAAAPQDRQEDGQGQSAPDESLRAGPRPWAGELRAADAAVLPGSGGDRLPRQARRHQRGQGFHLCRPLRALPAAWPRRSGGAGSVAATRWR